MSARSYRDRLRSRLSEMADQARVMPQLWFGANAISNEEDGVAAVVVSFNTLPLTKLMLLTLAEHHSSALRRIIVVDNGSADGSREFLQSLPQHLVELVANRGPSTHAAGLRCALDHLKRTEAAQPQGRGSGLALVLDSDIIVLRADLVPRLQQAFRTAEVAVAGELQFDVGEPYVHPSCMMLRRSCYDRHGIWPFVHHGAPALWFQRSVRNHGFRVVDVPVRSENYIVHRGQGTLERLREFVPGHPNASGNRGAHYHGNPAGAELWADAEVRHSKHLLPGNERQASDYIAERLGAATRR